MRFRVMAAAAAATVLPATLLTTVAPASAATECRDVDQGNTVVTRSCKVYSSRIGGLVEGGIYWDYKHKALGQNGDVVLDVKDRTADGKCTRVKIKYRDNTDNPNPPETRVWKFCNGARGPVRASLNDGEASGPGGDGGGPFPVYTKGYYKVEHCSGKRAKTCITLWRQNVAETKDPTD